MCNQFLIENNMCLEVRGGNKDVTETKQSQTFPECLKGQMTEGRGRSLCVVCGLFFFVVVFFCLGSD